MRHSGHWSGICVTMHEQKAAIGFDFGSACISILCAFVPLPQASGHGYQVAQQISRRASAVALGFAFESNLVPHAMLRASRERNKSFGGPIVAVLDFEGSNHETSLDLEEGRGLSISISCLISRVCSHSMALGPATADRLLSVWNSNLKANSIAFSGDFLDSSHSPALSTCQPNSRCP